MFDCAPESVDQDDAGNLVQAGPMTIGARHGDLDLSLTDLVSDESHEGIALAGELSAHATVTGGAATRAVVSPRAVR